MTTRMVKVMYCTSSLGMTMQTEKTVKRMVVSPRGKAASRRSAYGPRLSTVGGRDITHNEGKLTNKTVEAEFSLVYKTLVQTKTMAPYMKIWKCIHSYVMAIYWGTPTTKNKTNKTKQKSPRNVFVKCKTFFLMCIRVVWWVWYIKKRNYTLPTSSFFVKGGTHNGSSQWHQGAFHEAFCQCFSLTTVISYWNPCIWLAESKFVSEKHWQNAWWNAPQV